jgi:apolipoprotein N-acyltransferase
VFLGAWIIDQRPISKNDVAKAVVIAIQPNVPMDGMKYEHWKELRELHVKLAEDQLKQLALQNNGAKDDRTKIVIFPESPMNFGFTYDRDFQQFLKEFTARNKVQVLFNAGEPTGRDNGFYNSAVLVDEYGGKIAQYDKIHLVPFGEFVPLPEPLAGLVPSMVGNFDYGKEFDIVPLGDAKAGIMICFESHFPTLSRQYTLDGADVLVEMTNDGYLGPTPILRQHLANAVFRAVETNRPILRVTNVGISAYIDERGGIQNPTAGYTVDSRLWNVPKSDRKATTYVKFGDWFAWFSIVFTVGVLLLVFFKRRKSTDESASNE